VRARRRDRAPRQRDLVDPDTELLVQGELVDAVAVDLTPDRLAERLRAARRYEQQQYSAEDERGQAASAASANAP
jgi:hypothetical protein